MILMIMSIIDKNIITDKSRRTSNFHLHNRWIVIGIWLLYNICDISSNWNLLRKIRLFENDTLLCARLTESFSWY